MDPTRRVAVLGGGIGGLATAYFLGRHGCHPVVLEGSSCLGGLGMAFEHQGVRVDRFYHVLLDTDVDLLALIDELDLSGGLVWRPTAMGFHMGGRLHALNSPLDLLRFSALPLADRLWMGFGALRATRLQRNPRALDEIGALDWLRSLFGPRVTERIWKPLLRAKFGDAAPSIPAYWVWSLLNREKNGSQEVKGYLRGGYQSLADRLGDAIRKRGGTVRLNHCVERLERQGESFLVTSGSETSRFDVVISTLPLAMLRKVAVGELANELPLADLRYQGVVNALVVAKRPLERFYWTVVVDPRFEFQGVVETTHVIPPAWVGHRHLIYLMNYCDSASPLYQRGEQQVREQALEGLRLLYPHLRREDIEAVHVFRAPHVEPVWSLGYLKKRPRFQVGRSNLYLSTTAQAYPRVTAWNTSVQLAHEAVETIAAQHGSLSRPSASRSEQSTRRVVRDAA